MDALLSEMSGMLAMAEHGGATLSPIEAKAKQLVDLWSSLPSPSPGQRKRRMQRIMQDEDDVFGEDGATMSPCTTVALGISPVSAYTVVYNGLVFPTMMHAFQAQKADTSRQSKYTTCSLAESASMGRAEAIDISKWDANKDKLMLDIMRAYMNQHDHAKLALKDNDLTHLKETAVPDFYWSARIPGMWRNLKQEVCETE